MTYTLLLTLSQPLTATTLEKLWDAEQQRRCPDVTGRPRCASTLPVRTRSN